MKFRTATESGLFSCTTFTFVFIFFFGSLIVNQPVQAQNGQLVVNVKAGNLPLSGVPIYYTCDWAANLGGWSSWNSGTTDSNGQLTTPIGINLQNVVVEVGYIPWDLQQLYGNTAYPSQFVFASLTTTETIEFNLIPTEPEILVLQPSSIAVIGMGDSLSFTADVVIDSPYLIDSVIFMIDGFQFPSISGSGSIYTSIQAWIPLSSDFFMNHMLQAQAFGSNGSTSIANHSFYLECAGLNCPNQLPIISWLTPSATAINQPAGFTTIPITLAISDPDGSILSTQLIINGNPANLIQSGPNQYTYSFTPSTYGNYEFVIYAVDNESDTSILTKNLLITNSVFTPLPEKVIVGYWHSWDDASAPFLYLSEVASSHFNVVVYAFIETANGDGYTPQLTLNTTAYQSGGVFNPQLLKEDIQFLKDLGIPVLVSIGGQNGHVELTTTAEKDTFVQGIIQIVEEYGFDGIDLDFEGGSMNFGAGSLPDFSYSTISNGNYPKLKNVIDAFIEIDDYFGAGFHLTAAPELFYVQVGYGTYSNLAGSFLPVIENLRTRLDYIHVQLYNSGSVVALDNLAYSTGSADFVVAMTDMLLEGFNVSNTGIHFDALDESQVVIGLPACPNAAPAGGYVPPLQLTSALNYLVNGISFGGSYALQNNSYPDLRGVMTWSVNWDKTPSCGSAWEFSNNAWNFFGSAAPDTIPPIVIAQNQIIYLDSNGLAELTPQQVDSLSSDNVGIGLMTLSKSLFDCNDLGLNPITLIVYDLSGNSDSAFCVIEVLDTIPPQININDTTIILTDGPFLLNPEDFNFYCQDNCGITKISLNPAMINEPGLYSVMIIATDASFNSTYIQFQITAEQDMRINSVNDQSLLNIFPNPLNKGEIINLQSSKPISSVVIVGVDGSSQAEFFFDKGSDSVKLNAPALAGIYLLQIFSEAKCETIQLIVY